MEYTEVKSAHIVPRSYLLNFAVEEQLQLNVDGRQLPHPVSIDDAAVQRVYRRVRPDGTTIDDVEWSLSQMEGALAPIIQDLKGNWPPNLGCGQSPARGVLRIPVRERSAMEEVARGQAQGMDRRIAPQPRTDPPPSGLLIAVTQKRINENRRSGPERDGMADEDDGDLRQSSRHLCRNDLAPGRVRPTMSGHLRPPGRVLAEGRWTQDAPSRTSKTKAP